MTGISVVGLLTIAIGAMHGMPQLVFGNGVQALSLLALAFAVSAGFQQVGFMLFLGLGKADAITIGLISDYRNVTLTWVVVAPWHGGLPLMTKRLIARLAHAGPNLLANLFGSRGLPP